MSTPATVADLGERAIIERIRARLPPAPQSVVVGIGDDAAVVEPERNTLAVITTDALVEGVHFERAFMPAGAIGYKALAVSLSDLAAMGAAPRLALLSLALPPALPASDLDDLVSGLLALALQSRTAVVGGNVTGSPGPLMVDVTAVGSVRRRRVLTRAGARPGDAIYVSGSLGAASAGLASCRQRAAAADGTGAAVACEARFLCPEPRTRLGLLLGRARVASACIDLSDGLADGLRQLTGASGVGAVVDADRIPIDDETRRWFVDRGEEPLEAACSGGEDYELLFTVSRRRRRAFAAVERLIGTLACTQIGTITADGAVRWSEADRTDPFPAGFIHFR